MEVLEGNKSHFKFCISIAQDLSDYFTEKAIHSMKSNFQKQNMIVAIDGKDIVGFITFKLKSSEVAELTWLGVHPKYQNHGIGTKLVEHTSSDLKGKGVKIFMVKTLAKTDNSIDDPYESTREFYKKLGFIHIETIDPYSDWGPVNPCAILVRML
jgi:N-acetylglutamate synthase-like GNAT family acetyltransferase